MVSILGTAPKSRKREVVEIGVTPKVNLMECVTHMTLPRVNKAATLALKQEKEV